MPSEDRVRTTVSKFLSDLSIPKLTAMLAGTEYDLFDLSLQFNDWIGLFAKEFETRKDLGCEYSDVLVQLLRNEDLERIVNDTNIKDYPDAAEWYFIGGFYDQISDIDTCLGMSTTSLKERIRRAKVEALERHKIRIPRRGITRRRAKDRPNPTKREEIPNKIPEEIPLEDRIRLSQTFQKTGIVGNAPAMFNVYDEIAHTCEQLIRFPKQPLNVLITGPSGTGKQLVAEAIHKLSGRQGEFRKIDCSAIVRLQKGRLHRGGSRQEGNPSDVQQRYYSVGRDQQDAALSPGEDSTGTSRQTDPASWGNRA